MVYISKQPEHAYWVTNISNRDVSIGDLRVTIRKHTSINLMDARHYHYTLEQIQASAESGSLYAKRDKIKVRNVPPEPPVKPGIYVSKDPKIPPRFKSPVVYVEPQFEELRVSDTDEKVANEMSDMADDLVAPSIPRTVPKK